MKLDSEHVCSETCASQLSIARLGVDATTQDWEWLQPVTQDSGFRNGSSHPPDGIIVVGCVYHWPQL